MIAEESRKVARASRRLGPHSKLLERGSLDGRSREGRFLRHCEAELAKHVGGKPSIAQRLLISRLARVALRLELFDEKIAAGTLTDHDARVYGALHNSFRLLLREIGMRGAAARATSLAEYLAAKAAAKAAAPPSEAAR
jgi:hypothetical protein